MKRHRSPLAGTGHGTGALMPAGVRQMLAGGKKARRRQPMHPRQKRFEDSRGRTIPAKKRRAALCQPLDADLAGAFILAAKARGWFGKHQAKARAVRDCRARLARGEITYVEACAAAPHASEDTKRKWRKVARA